MKASLLIEFNLSDDETEKGNRSPVVALHYYGCCDRLLSNQHSLCSEMGHAALRHEKVNLFLIRLRLTDTYCQKLALTHNHTYIRELVVSTKNHRTAFG